MASGNQWGNLCSSHRVQKYVKAIRLQQVEAHVTPKQAVPLFSDKIRWLAGEICGRLSSLEANSDSEFIQIYIYLRDLAFSSCACGGRIPSSGLRSHQNM